MTSIFKLHWPRITHKFCVAPNSLSQEHCLLACFKAFQVWLGLYIVVMIVSNDASQ